MDRSKLHEFLDDWFDVGCPETIEIIKNLEGDVFVGVKSTIKFRELVPEVQSCLLALCQLIPSVRIEVKTKNGKPDRIEVFKRAE